MGTKMSKMIRPKKINVVFPLSLPTLIFCADPKVFIAIFRQTVKVLPTLFFSAMKAETH